MTRLSHVGNPSVYEAGDQRGARTESEQLHHGRISIHPGDLLSLSNKYGLANRATDIEVMRDTGHTSKMAAEHEHKVRTHIPITQIHRSLTSDNHRRHSREDASLIKEKKKRRRRC